LDLYVAAELEQTAADQIYPAIWRHLQQCIQCQGDYELLRDVFKAEQAVALAEAQVARPSTSPPLRKPASPRQRTIPAWEQRTISSPSGRTAGRAYTFSVSYLQQKLISPRAVYRSEQSVAGPEAKLLLYDDSIVLESQVLTVELMATPSPENKDLLIVQAAVRGEAQLPENLQARLVWGGEVQVVTVVGDGRVELGAIRMEALHDDRGMFEFALEIPQKSGG
jgi:hypothetical protein